MTTTAAATLGVVICAWEGESIG